jgi:DNA replication protein DnaC
MSETLDQKRSALGLARIRQVYPSWIEQAERLELGYGEVLEQVATEELLSRQENHLRRQMKAAGFPYAATIEQFDFLLHPELRRAVVMRLFDSSLITTPSSLLLIGPSGVGKTHLAVALGTKMVHLGYLCALSWPSPLSTLLWPPQREQNWLASSNRSSRVICSFSTNLGI